VKWCGPDIETVPACTISVVPSNVWSVALTFRSPLITVPVTTVMALVISVVWLETLVATARSAMLLPSGRAGIVYATS
jgi:hypothetical protein